MFTFESVIQFEVTFMKGLNSTARFVFLHVGVQWLQHPLLKRQSSLPCQRSVDCISVGLFLSSHLPFLSLIPHYLGYCGFALSLDTG